MIATNNERITARVSLQIKQTLVDAVNHQLSSIWFYGFAIQLDNLFLPLSTITSTPQQNNE